MKKENLVRLITKAMELLKDLRDSIEDYSTYSSKMEKTMTPEETETFTTITFYTFTMMLSAFVLALPIMMLRGYPFIALIITLLTIGFALPAVMLVVLRKYYWRISSKISLFFQKNSLPLIGQKEQFKTICKVQMKFFKPLRNTSVIIVSCYILMNLATSSSYKFLSLFFEILLSIISWTGAAIMAVDGIYMYSTCLWKINIDLAGYKKLMGELKISIEAIGDSLMAIFVKLRKVRIGFAGHQTPKRAQRATIETIKASLRETFAKKPKYVPKRLAVKNTSIRENIFSLKMLAEDVLASYLSARAKSV